MGKEETISEEEVGKRMVQEATKWEEAYNSRFEVDTILVRDELLRRQPQESRSYRLYRFYECGFNPVIANQLADDLDRLASPLDIPSD